MSQLPQHEAVPLHLQVEVALGDIGRQRWMAARPLLQAGYPSPAVLHWLLCQQEAVLAALSPRQAQEAVQAEQVMRAVACMQKSLEAINAALACEAISTARTYQLALDRFCYAASALALLHLLQEGVAQGPAGAVEARKAKERTEAVLSLQHTIARVITQLALLCCSPTIAMDLLQHVVQRVEEERAPHGLPSSASSFSLDLHPTPLLAAFSSMFGLASCSAMQLWRAGKQLDALAALELPSLLFDPASPAAGGSATLKGKAERGEKVAVDAILELFHAAKLPAEVGGKAVGGGGVTGGSSSSSGSNAVPHAVHAASMQGSTGDGHSTGSAAHSDVAVHLQPGTLWLSLLQAALSPQPGAAGGATALEGSSAVLQAVAGISEGAASASAPRAAGPGSTDMTAHASPVDTAASVGTAATALTSAAVQPLLLPGMASICHFSLPELVAAVAQRQELSSSDWPPLSAEQLAARTALQHLLSCLK